MPSLQHEHNDNPIPVQPTVSSRTQDIHNRPAPNNTRSAGMQHVHFPASRDCKDQLVEVERVPLHLRGHVNKCRAKVQVHELLLGEKSC